MNVTTLDERARNARSALREGARQRLEDDTEPPSGTPHWRRPLLVVAALLVIVVGFASVVVARRDNDHVRVDASLQVVASNLPPGTNGLILGKHVVTYKNYDLADGPHAAVEYAGQTNELTGHIVAGFERDDTLYLITTPMAPSEPTNIIRIGQDKNRRINELAITHPTGAAYANGAIWITDPDHSSVWVWRDIEEATTPSEIKLVVRTDPTVRTPSGPIDHGPPEMTPVGPTEIAAADNVVAVVGRSSDGRMHTLELTGSNAGHEFVSAGAPLRIASDGKMLLTLDSAQAWTWEPRDRLVGPTSQSMVDHAGNETEMRYGGGVVWLRDGRTLWRVDPQTHEQTQVVDLDTDITAWAVDGRGRALVLEGEKAAVVAVG